MAVSIYMQQDIIIKYKTLLEQIDSWFAAAVDRFPDEISCKRGCSGCCRGLFDITLLDAAMLQQGYSSLPSAVRQQVKEKASQRLEQLRSAWPELSPPYTLNDHPEDRWDEIMPDEDETPCVLLDSDGRCIVYEHRPMTCRLHGLPLIDVGGEIMHDEWCTENFRSANPIEQAHLAAPFSEIFTKEVKYGREFTGNLLGEVVFELDTLIPLSLLVDYSTFDWHSWWQKERQNFLNHSNTESLSF